MPHATMPAIEFQAVILCGPGESLNPFNANPKELPKALIPIANRPMLWYPLDWCHRSGITNVTLVAPEASRSALENALSHNEHLKSIKFTTLTLLSPADLTFTTGTAEILRLPEVQNAIVRDFIILPCDLVCDMSGIELLDSWIRLHGALSSTPGKDELRGRRGGLGVWYHTKDSLLDGQVGVGVKKEETDFLATAELSRPIVPPPTTSLTPRIENVVMAMPTSVLKDNLAEFSGLKTRTAALRRFGNIRLRTTLRDAHVYIFPYWVKEYVFANTRFESISEDVLGWWAKAGWQEGLAQKLHIDTCLGRANSSQQDASHKSSDLDISGMSTTSGPTSFTHDLGSQAQKSQLFASRVVRNTSHARDTETPDPTIPSLLAYTHPPQPTASLLRRVDTVPLLLSSSVFLARLPAYSEHPLERATFSPEHKVHPDSVPPPHLRLTIDKATVLVDRNVTFTSKSTIKDSVIGSNCILGTPAAATINGEQSTADAIKNAPAGVRIQRCVLMEGVNVEAGCALTGCVLGRNCKIGEDSDLKDCFVQEGYVVPKGTVAKGEVLAGFEEGMAMEDGFHGSEGDHADAVADDFED